MIVPDEGVEDGDEFSGDGDDCDELGFAVIDEAVAESLKAGIVASCDESPHVESRADGGTSSTDEAFASPLSGLARPRCQTDESCDLVSVERAEFR